MALFRKRNKNEKTVSCCCGGNCDADSMAKTERTKAAGFKVKSAKTERTKADGMKLESIKADGVKQEDTKTEGVSVKVLGSGCARCNQLETAVKAALEQLGIDTTIDHVTDFPQIASYGVMTTPALVVNGKVASYGKVLKTEEVVKILQKVRQ